MAAHNENIENEPEDFRYTFDGFENGINEEDLLPAEPDTDAIYGQIVETRVFFPFVRWLYLPKYFETNELLKNDNRILVELVVILLGVLSYAFWPYVKQSITEHFMFASWLFVLMYMVALAYANVKTKLLPDKILFGLFIASVFFVMTKTIELNNMHVLWSSLVGFFAVSIIPWLIYQMSRGRYLGGGVVKTSAVVGFLLGVKLGLVAMVSVILIAIAYQGFIHYFLKKNQQAKIVETGIIWLIVVVALQLFGTLIAR